MSAIRPDEAHQGARRWHWLRVADGRLYPVEWIPKSGNWLFNGRGYTPESMALRGFVYDGPAVLPAQARAMRCDLREAIDALDFDRGEPVERGRSCKAWAGHLVRRALDRAGLGRTPAREHEGTAA